MSKKLCLALPIPTMPLDTKAKNSSLEIPFLHFRDWLLFLLENNCSHILAGLVRPDAQREGDIWQAFWQKFEVQEPKHPIFAAARDGRVDLRRCFPLYLHGDEGRSKKRQPFLVVSLHSPLGRGIEAGLKSATKRAYLKMLPNFVGHSYTNRFLVAALPKEDYTGDNSFVFDVLMQAVAQELRYMSAVGVTYRGQEYFAWCLGVVGDWPWLVKSGGLQRSFMCVPKHRGQEGQRQRAEPRGVCHMCLAGRSHFPYEQVGSRHPDWEASVLAESPFDRPNPLAVIPHVEGQFPLFFHYDLFHTWHLGVAKNYLGSVLAILSGQESGGNVDMRFDQLSDKYRQWCSENKRPAHCQRISKEHVSWLSTSHFPTGGWRKGDLSTSLMLWVEARFAAERWEDEELRVAGEAARAINKCIRILYASGAWLEPQVAEECANLGLQFLRRYSTLARAANQAGRRFWLVMPKAHSLHHLFLGLLHRSSVGPVMNLLLTSVQQDEDYIGRQSRLSRHVSTMTCSRPVVERHLQAAYSRYVEVGYLVSPSG
eukprot:Skav214206  [mRNA]  locus=scaffold489:76556:78175:- [translate_table: standard]